MTGTIAEHTPLSGSKEKSTTMIEDGFEYSLGPPSSGFSIFLASRTKKVHFISHAEGEHDVATKEMGSNNCLLRENSPASVHPLYDARLSPEGIRQAKQLREILAHRPSGGRSFTAFDLVIVSPLTRACETAKHIFGRARKPGLPSFLDPGRAPPGTVEHKAEIPVPAPRILIREECRERYGRFVCDGRRSIREIAAEFPDFDFSEIAHDQDVFHGDKRESDEECQNRSMKFLEWLNSRPEKCIAVVTHSSFLLHLFGQFGKNLKIEDKDSLQRVAGNCELRSVVLCSHGNKEGKDIEPMNPPQCADSTIRVPSCGSLAGLTN